MTLVRWTPWREALSIEEETGRLFSDLFSGGVRKWIRPDRRDSFYWPVVDISEADDEYIVRAELPGIKQEDVKVSVHDRTLTISGENLQPWH